jgi:hypothetical protein
VGFGIMENINRLLAYSISVSVLRQKLENLNGIALLIVAIHPPHGFFLDIPIHRA